MKTFHRIFFSLFLILGTVDAYNMFTADTGEQLFLAGLCTFLMVYGANNNYRALRKLEQK